jgi:hypothetical protein
MHYTTKLKVSYNYDFEVLGILTEVPEYKIAWLLNGVLEIYLVKTEPVVLSFFNRRCSFSNLKHETDYRTVQLIKNKSLNLQSNLEDNFLLPDLNKYPFLLIQRDECKTHTMGNLAHRIMTLDEVEAVALLNPEELEHRENLIFY